MLKLFTVLCWLSLFSLATLAQDNKALDKKNGFGKAKLGAPLRSFKHLVFSGNPQPGQAEYVLPAEQLTLGNVPVKGVKYLFAQDRLMAIRVDLDDSLGFEAAVRVMESLYGRGKYTAYDELQKYVWRGEKVQLTCMTVETVNGVVANLHFLNLPLYKETHPQSAEGQPAK